MLRSCLPNGESQFPTSRFVIGVSSLDRPTPDRCAGNRDGSGTSGTLTYLIEIKGNNLFSLKEIRYEHKIRLEFGYAGWF